jgi:hypothetical protein
VEKATPLEQFAEETARDILNRHAPECLDRPGLRDAIARLARLGLENSMRLYQLEQLKLEKDATASQGRTHQQA